MRSCFHNFNSDYCNTFPNIEDMGLLSHKGGGVRLLRGSWFGSIVSGQLLRGKLLGRGPPGTIRLEGAWLEGFSLEESGLESSEGPDVWL